MQQLTCTKSNTCTHTHTHTHTHIDPALMTQRIRDWTAHDDDDIYLVPAAVISGLICPQHRQALVNMLEGSGCGGEGESEGVVGLSADGGGKNSTWAWNERGAQLPSRSREALWLWAASLTRNAAATRISSLAPPSRPSNGFVSVVPPTTCHHAVYGSNMKNTDAENWI